MQRKRASLQNSPLPCSHGSEIVCGAIYGRCTMHDISHTRGQCNTTCEESEAEDNEIASMVPTLRALSLSLCCCVILNWGSHCTDCIMSNKVTRLVFVPSLRNNHPTFPSGALTNGRKRGLCTHWFNRKENGSNYFGPSIVQSCTLASATTSN